MKNTILLLFLCSLMSLSAQNVKGKLTLNGKSELNLELKSNSAVQLFKEFKTGKYQLNFNYEANDIPMNIYKETIVFFDVLTIIKKDGKIVKNLQRKQPIAYFPGEQALPAEAFDFIGALANQGGEEEDGLQMLKKGLYGTMPEGKYTVQLRLKPIDFKGEIAPIEFSFILRKRPGRAK